MSRIDDLIAELCPKGVESRELQDLFVTRNGYTPSKSDSSLWSNGTVPWFRMEDLRENGGVLDKAFQYIPDLAVKGGRLFPANSILIATSATIGEHALITVPHLSNQRFTSLALKPKYADRFEMKFVYYYCFVLDEWCRHNTTTSSFASVDMSKFKKFRFPMPPLAVQRQIVSVLDKFTQLEAELEAELEARRIQYEYYLRSLLSFDDSRDNVRWLTLGELCNISRGRVISKDYLTENAGEYPVYSSQTENNGVFGRIVTFAYDFESITWTTDGANAGSVFYHKNEKFSITNVCGLLQVKVNDLSTRFLFYALQILTKPHVRAGMGNPKLMSHVMSTIKVPVPTIEEQSRIVGLLDNFDRLVNGISEGLPAELTARREQYEFYRNRLLDFEVVVA